MFHDAGTRDGSAPCSKISHASSSSPAFTASVSTVSFAQSVLSKLITELYRRTKRATVGSPAFTAR